MVVFVVDSVRKLDDTLKQTVTRLKRLRFDPENRKLLDAMKDGTFSDEKFEKGFYDMSEEEKKLHSWHMPSVLVMNKVDLVTNKVKMRSLQNEIEDLGEFEKIFHTSTQTGFGIDALIQYLLNKAKLRNWEVHPDLISKQSEVEKAEAAMK